MRSVLIALVGWPGVLFSLSVMAAAFLANSYRLTIVGALLSAPFLLYVSGYPRIGVLGVLVLACNLLAAWLLKRERPWLAVLFIAPYIGLATWIAYLVVA